jgi:hypothetical protein
VREEEDDEAEEMEETRKGCPTWFHWILLSCTLNDRLDPFRPLAPPFDCWRDLSAGHLPIEFPPRLIPLIAITSILPAGRDAGLRLSHGGGSGLLLVEGGIVRERSGSSRHAQQLGDLILLYTSTAIITHTAMATGSRGKKVRSRE